MIRRLCVFCGAHNGASPIYARMARELGAALVERGIALVYGGGNIGLMGLLADATLEKRGVVIGVIPEILRAREVAHYGVTDLRVVGSMHERKALMADLADGFVALPGGLGTLEELLEISTWGQLGFHCKPVGLLNANGYFDALLAQLDRAVAEGFLPSQHREMLIVEEKVEALLEALETAVPEQPCSDISVQQRS